MDVEPSRNNVRLHGYKFSVYAWIARLALHEKGVRYDWVEIDPFADVIPDTYLAMNPFGRVPTLQIDDFVLFETTAITRFIDNHFTGPNLRSGFSFQQARIDQIISIIDNYAYWPLVRQVFSSGYFGPLNGEQRDINEIDLGLKAAKPVLDTPDKLSGGMSFLVGESVSLADIHLAPMISYFIEPDEGREMFENYPCLVRWWSGMATRGAFLQTKPELAPPV